MIHFCADEVLLILAAVPFASRLTSYTAAWLRRLHSGGASDCAHGTACSANQDSGGRAADEPALPAAATHYSSMAASRARAQAKAESFGSLYGLSRRTTR